MTSSAKAIGFAVVLAAAAAGCDKGSPTSSVTGGPATAPAKADAPAVGGPAAASGPAGSIEGTVSLDGPAPAMKALDTAACPMHESIQDEAVVANAGGHLKNVIVYLDGAGPAGAAPPAPVLLDQVGCRYTPHVVAVQVGQTLEVKNSDPTLHNVNMQSFDNPARNVGTLQGQTIDVTFVAPEIFKTVCNVHPWMGAWVGVFSHPWFAVTGDDGNFEIRNVPPGRYTLTAWQETYKQVSQPVTVTAGQQTLANVAYRAKR